MDIREQRLGETDRAYWYTVIGPKTGVHPFEWIAYCQGVITGHRRGWSYSCAVRLYQKRPDIFQRFLVLRRMGLA